jgi:hypothetical protein
VFPVALLVEPAGPPVESIAPPVAPPVARSVELPLAPGAAPGPVSVLPETPALEPASLCDMPEPVVVVVLGGVVLPRPVSDVEPVVESLVSSASRCILHPALSRADAVISANTHAILRKFFIAVSPWDRRNMPILVG